MLSFTTFVSLALLASTASAQKKRFVTVPDVLSNETVSTSAPTPSLASNATLPTANATIIYTNGTFALLPNGSIIAVDNSTSFGNDSSTSTTSSSLLPFILPTNATTTTTTATVTDVATTTATETATQIFTQTDVVTIYAPTPSPIVSYKIDTLLSTVLTTTTTTEEAPKPTSVADLIKDLDEAGMMAKILPTIYLTMVPHRESDGHWDYVVYNGEDGTATASPTSFVSSSPTPTTHAHTTTTQVPIVVTTTTAIADPSPSLLAAISSMAAILESAPVAVVSSEATGTEKYSVPPTITDPAVIESLLPTTTPTFVYSLPGESGTVVLVPTTTSTATTSDFTIASSIALHLPSQAVASAVATGGVVGVVPSSQGDDEPESSFNGTGVAGNSTSLPSSNFTLSSNTSSAPLPVQTQWNSTHLPLGNDEPSLSNSTSPSSIVVGSVRPASASAVPTSLSSLVASASEVISIVPLSLATPSASAASVLVQTIQMGSSLVVVALPVATPSASASVEENDSGVKSVFITSGTTTTTVTTSSSALAAEETSMRRVVRKRSH